MTSQDGGRQQEAGPSHKCTRGRRVWKEQRSPSADPEHIANSQELSAPSSSGELPGSPCANPEHIAAPGAAPRSTNFEIGCSRLVELKEKLAIFLKELDQVRTIMIANNQEQEYVSFALSAKADFEKAVDADAQCQRSSSQIAVTSDTAIGGQPRQESWRRPKDPVPLVRSPKRASPSYHVMGSGRGRLPSTRFDSKIQDHVQEYITRLEQQHPELMTTPVKLNKPWIPDGHKKQRIVAYEHTINHYFVAEVAPLIKAILHTSRPEARFEVIEGSPNGQADLFLRVCIKNKRKEWVYSSVAVELKRPYGTKHEESARASQENWPEWMRDAEMPNDNVAELVLRQIFAYMRGSDARAPRYVRGSITSHIGFVSNYNGTWIISVESHANATTNSGCPSKCLRVSSRFSLDSTKIPIAFVYAYVLDRIVADMKTSTEGYKEEKDLDGDSE
ncbi:hypothetical protein GGF42_001619 [Coemansia sp. RSA 2424]|nr:hypothetical protein GGF42_001619 [Coemansia sp. RSA 2424]